jgi:hypothetical protein
MLCTVQLQLPSSHLKYLQIRRKTKPLLVTPYSNTQGTSKIYDNIKILMAFYVCHVCTVSTEYSDVGM